MLGEMVNNNLTKEEKSQIAEKLTKQLISLSNTSGKALSDFLEDSNKQNAEIQKWSNAITKITQATKTFGEHSTFLYASLFLSVYEVAYVAHLDSICLLYIKSGHDLYDPLHNNFAKTFEEIGKVSTFVKFHF